MTWMRRLRRGAALAALALCGVGMLPGAAAAQRFTFDKKKYQAAPGETVEIGVYLSGVSANVSGANFTVRIAQGDAALARFTDATSSANPQLTALGFLYADNQFGRAGVTSGEIRGSVRELRGAVYSPLNPPFTFPAAAPRLIATLRVPIDIAAAGRVLVELVSAEDNGVALLGAADAAGNPLVPAGRAVPEGDLASIVIEPANAPLTTDLRELRNQSGWIFSSPLPAGGPPALGEGLSGTGLVARSVVHETYGVWQWDFLNRGEWRSPAAGRLHVMDWSVKSDVAGVETPPFRLRVMTTNSMMSAEALYQDIWQNNDSVSLVPTPAGRTYRTIVEVPAFAADGHSGDGLVPYFDLMQFGQIGVPGARLVLERLVERIVDPAALAGKRTDYFQTFDANNDGGWKFTVGDTGGKEVLYGRGRYGLGITSGGPLETTGGGGYRFSYGYWYAPPGVIKLKADSARWYRVEAQVRGTADNPVWNPAVRLRMYPANNEYFNMLLFAPQLEPEDYHVPRPDLEGRMLTAWFLTPAEVNGMDLGMSFDLIHLDGPPDGTERTPGLFLNWVRITSFDAPALP